MNVYDGQADRESDMDGRTDGRTTNTTLKFRILYEGDKIITTAIVKSQPVAAANQAKPIRIRRYYVFVFGKKRCRLFSLLDEHTCSTIEEMEAFQNAVGQNYHAISPSENYTSVNELSHETFRSFFEVKDAGTLGDLFLYGNLDARPPPDGWIERVQNALLDTESVEDKMNAVLQSALQKVGANVSSLNVNDSGDKVSERYIRNLLNDCFAGGLPEGTQHLNGLPISLNSRPDFALWVYNRTMLSGDGKHKDNYDLAHAIRQSASYALVHPATQKTHSLI